MNHFIDTLDSLCKEKPAPFLLGMDPICEHFPPELKPTSADDPKLWSMAFESFARQIITELKGITVGVKFQSAFYERLGEYGLRALRNSLGFAKQQGLLTVLDLKRGDIGSTAAAYAEAYLGRLPETCGPLTDAVTVNPYLGEDSIAPFVEIAKKEGKGVFVLVKTSNPSGPQFQDLEADGAPLYVHVARLVSKLGSDLLGSCGLSALGAVVGATYPQVLGRLRDLMPQNIFLLPGVGKQGGKVSDLSPAFLPGGRGALVTASRSVLYAYRSYPDLSFQQAAKKSAEILVNELKSILP